ncbi:rhomboid-like protein [Actinomadura atramentaria]|uniref:rhomboid-like protein n=1 Tax=Actinomadura atramentaria TaxID=1990 RepID=UPI000525FB7A|nr:rhomboid-like protein [Actinomadura atramentaria]
MIVGVLAALLAWYALRGLGAVWEPAGRVVARCAPWTRAAHAWILEAPATFGYVAVFTASTLVQVSAPPKLIDLLTTLQSTNLRNLHREPLHALVNSALWVADKGNGLVFYVIVFVTVVAWGERRWGTPRSVVIGLTAHVVGTLLTALAETSALESGRAPQWLAVSTDVGVSYIMVGQLAGAILLMRGRVRIAAASVLTLALALPLVFGRTVWDVGHVLAALVGLGVAVGLLWWAPPRRPPRLARCLPCPQPCRWRTGSAAAPGAGGD